MLPIAIQLYSLRNEMEANVEETLKTVKALGYDGVEFASLCGKTPKEMKQLLNDIGLVPVSAHIPLCDLRNDINKVISDYKSVGCKNLVVPYLPDEDRPAGEGFKAVVADLEKFGQIIREAGMTLSYHNHDFEFVKMENGEYGFDYLYSNTSPENLKVQQDTCWVKVAGEDPVAYLKKYADRSPLLHLKDFAGEKSANMYNLIGIEETKTDKPQSFEFRPVGYGVQDFKSIVSTAENCGVEWFIVEQDEPSMGKTPLECAKMSIDYLKSI